MLTNKQLATQYRGLPQHEYGDAYTMAGACYYAQLREEEREQPTNSIKVFNNGRYIDTLVLTK